MLQELKIRINDHKIVEEQLKNLGASFVEEKIFTDTYFNQPVGKVLKLAKINNTFFLEELEAVDGKFHFINDEQIDTAKEITEKLSNQYSIETILTGKRRIYQLDSFKITLNLIDNLGEFLILTGENPTENFLTDKLGIKNPEYIRVPFNKLQSH